MRILIGSLAALLALSGAAQAHYPGSDTWHDFGMDLGALGASPVNQALGVCWYSESQAPVDPGPPLHTHLGDILGHYYGVGVGEDCGGMVGGPACETGSENPGIYVLVGTVDAFPLVAFCHGAEPGALPEPPSGPPELPEPLACIVANPASALVCAGAPPIEPPALPPEVVCILDGDVVACVVLPEPPVGIPPLPEPPSELPPLPEPPAEIPPLPEPPAEVPEEVACALAATTPEGILACADLPPSIGDPCVIEAPDPMDCLPPLPSIPPLPLPASFNQCLGSTTIVHVCVGAVPGWPSPQDPLPPVLGTPAADCVPSSDPTVAGFLVVCTASASVNGRTASALLSVHRGLVVPPTPAPPAVPPLPEPPSELPPLPEPPAIPPEPPGLPVEPPAIPPELPPLPEPPAAPDPLATLCGLGLPADVATAIGCETA